MSDQRKPVMPADTASSVPDGAAGVERFHVDLHRIARRELKRMVSSGTIDTVALVNEAYLRVEGAECQWQSRAHFLASMTTVMRHVLVDYARERGAQRRGGDWLQLTGSSLDDIQGAGCPANVLALDAAMSELGRLSDRLERVVELKVFGGLTIPEIAEALDVSTSTVSREMRLAGAFLRKTLAAE
jgi:RNA polymerase sigma factor (TIGR02999 family)